MLQELKPQIRYNSNSKHLQYTRRIPQIPGRISQAPLLKKKCYRTAIEGHFMVPFHGYEAGKSSHMM